MLTKFRDKLVAIFGKKESKSSISDTNQYREICLRAAKTKEAFLNFKQNIHYKEILEHTNLETGFKYLKKIKSNSEIYRVIKNFSVNDKFGQPDLHSFPEIGPFSPSTLRYVKVLTDLVERFDSLSGLKIVEIGGGYGGQSLIIHKYARPSSYQILDLPEVLLLTEKYLNCHGIKSVKLHTLDEYLNHRRDFDRDPDLLISNYAFSEISAEIQEIYLRDIILKSKRGYMTMNSISAGCGVSSIPQKDIQKLLQAKGPIHIENEDPLTFPGNQVWIS